MDEKTNSVTSAAASVGADLFNQTSSFLNWIKGFVTWDNIFKIAGIILVLFVILIAFKILVHALKRIPEEKMSKQRFMMIRRLLRYVFYVICVMYILSAFGVKLSAIWGAAGIAGVALGFAAQTSVSNLISGLFVLTEGSLKIGDMIIVGGTTGIVDQVNLLSVRVHTLDNQMVRIPNSTIINNSLTNNNFHEQRRLTLDVSISYSSDMKTALDALSKAPSLCPTVLADPAPAVWFDGFGDSGINMTVAAWYKPADFLQTKNDLYIAMKKVLDEANIEIPFNQLDVQIKK